MNNPATANPQQDPAATEKAQRIDQLLARIHERVPAAERASVEAFARAYFQQVDPEDVLGRSGDDWYGALLSLWQFARTRTPGQLRLRVLSPTVAEHGFNSRHTVIQLVNDDMPFLVDSTTMEINRQGLTLHLIIHPIVAVERDKAGHLTALKPREGTAGNKPDSKYESLMHIEVDRLLDADAIAALTKGIEHALNDVRAAVEDWPTMLKQLRESTTELELAASKVGAEELTETRAFLDWLADEHMLLLGYRRHDLLQQGGDDVLKLVPGSGLGVLRESGEEAISGSFAALPAQARSIAHAPSPLIITTKANTRSTVHRPGYVDYVGIKRFNKKGDVIGEHRFVGLYTSTAYAAHAREIPLIRGKVAAVAQRAGLAPNSHLGKALAHILETYPRDELFQISADELFDISNGVLQLGERQRFRLFVRRDPFERFVSCLIYVPRESYSTELRRRFHRILMESFDGTSADFDVMLSDAILARIHFTVRTTPGKIPAFDRRAIETKLAAAARRWEDDLRDALIETDGEAHGALLFKRFGGAFPVSYRERIAARAAVADVRNANNLVDGKSALAVSLYQPLEREPGELGFKLYHAGEPVVLSESLPMLERMGVRVLSENTYEVAPLGAATADKIWLHDFELQSLSLEEVDADAVRPLFEESFARVFRGQVENDDFNRLVLRAGLSADDVVVLRAYAKYMRQIGFSLSQSFIEATLSAHPRIARQLSLLFKLRFDPAQRNAEAEAQQIAAIEQALDKVSNLNEDRVLRQYLALMRATLRTNFWRTGVGASGTASERRSFVSFKFDPSKVPGLPEPKPMFEIFVYSPRFEGIHLRGGKVARGGLRWSDRPEDFRTEVLGLVKAQMVKNTVIVPVGSKGGFVLKKAPSASDRDAYFAEGVACYKDFLRGLLDLTDNLVSGKIVPPPHVVRHDADDPYLVVAADKGTATFSDYANGISAEYGHWLGDAFASGGSVGYDHKKMGITARGAWESVKRHFREMGIDTQTTEFTVVGIGDMSGDVFGNGMLLSKHIRLIAAFDHRHIFIDPNPDAAKSFIERQRMFDLPRSSWADYNAELISAGGGVWPRSIKSVPISPQARAVLGITAESLTPTELISAILKAPVDLLYNGGIGTYVKSSRETHAQVGDRANDALRVNGNELRCKVIGEGGNLGFTQLGRIEYALQSGRAYTDAIDNSAGVDTSDHEVNIKILLGLVMADGELTEKQRNTLLAEMTDDVAALVLRDNYFQTQSISLGGRIAPKLLDQQHRFMRFLEKQNRLNRAIEFLPTDEEIAERRAKGIGLTSPERSVLLAYSKMWLFDELLASDLPEDAWIATALERYFPEKLRARYGKVMTRHPLKREIVATHVLNSMVNRVGSTFVHRLSETTGAGAAHVVRAYLLTRETFGHVQLWQAIEALDNKVPDAMQAEMISELGRLTVRSTTWFLRSRRLGEPMADTIKRFAPAAETLLARTAKAIERGVHAKASELVARWTQAGVPAELARRVASAELLLSALDVVEIAEQAKRPLDTVADVHLAISERLGLTRLRSAITQLPSDGYWQALSKGALGDDLASLQGTLAAEALKLADKADAAVAAWEERNATALARAKRLLDELADVKTQDLAMLSVALRELRNLA